MCFSCFPCFLFIVFYSAGVQVFVGFKIVDNQAGMSSPTNAGQSCAVSLPLFLLFILSREYLLLLELVTGYERSPYFMRL